MQCISTPFYYKAMERQADMTCNWGGVALSTVFQAPQRKSSSSQLIIYKA